MWFLVRCLYFTLLVTVSSENGQGKSSDRDSVLVEKSCHSTKTSTVRIATTGTYMCYELQSERTGFLWKKKTVYKRRRSTCTRRFYKVRMHNETERSCCEGEVQEGELCRKLLQPCKSGMNEGNCSLSCNCGTTTDCDRLKGGCGSTPDTSTGQPYPVMTEIIPQSRLSRESNSSLPSPAGLIAGIVLLILAIVGLVIGLWIFKTKERQRKLRDSQLIENLTYNYHCAEGLMLSEENQSTTRTMSDIPEYANIENDDYEPIELGNQNCTVADHKKPSIYSSNRQRAAIANEYSYVSAQRGGANNFSGEKSTSVNHLKISIAEGQNETDGYISMTSECHSDTGENVYVLPSNP